MTANQTVASSTITGMAPTTVSAPVTSHDRSILAGFFLIAAAVLLATSGGHTYSIDEELMFQGTRGLVNLSPSIVRDFPNDELYRDRPDGTTASVYGLGQSLVGVPLYAVGRLLTVLDGDESSDYLVRVVTFQTNALITAATAVLIALTAKRLGASLRGGILLGTIYAFGTFAFPHAKTFGSEPGTAFLVLSACHCLITYRLSGKRQLLFWGGFLAALAASFRISTLAFMPAMGAYVLWAHRNQLMSMVKSAIALCCGVISGLCLLGFTNWWRYGSPVDVGYGDISAVSGYPMFRGLFNLYFSTGKSFFLFAPVCAVIVVALMARRNLTAEFALFLALIVINSSIVARLSVWSGDLTWGPRYLHVTLPLFVCLGAGIVDMSRWHKALRTSFFVGLLGPAMLGLILYFGVFFIRANDALGGDPVPSENFQPEYVIAVRHDLAWNQILGHLELAPAAIRDALNAHQPDEPVRWQYSDDPTTHFGYYGYSPGIDAWWMWTQKTNRTHLTYVMFLPIALSAVIGTRRLLKSTRDVRLVRRVEQKDLRESGDTQAVSFHAEHAPQSQG